MMPYITSFFMPRKSGDRHNTVYTSLDVDRGVPEIFNSCYDIYLLLKLTSKMLDGKKLTAFLL